MVDIPTALAVGTVVTFVPLVAGIVSPRILDKVGRQPATTWMTAAAAGIMFWFFIDVVNDAAQLDIISGFGNGLGDYTHAILALMFAVGIGVLFGLESKFSVPKPLGAVENMLPFAAAAIAALGIGFHAFGEGMDIGSTLPKAVDLLEAIGGYYPGIAYVLHKFFEGFVVGVFAVIASASSGRKIGALIALSGVPTILGFLAGIPNMLDSSYFFALGAAATIYVEFRLLPLVSKAKPYAFVIPLLLGFYAMYFAGLFHN
jgi:zinc transporter ZupT